MTQLDLGPIPSDFHLKSGFCVRVICHCSFISSAAGYALNGMTAGYDKVFIFAILLVSFSVSAIALLVGIYFAVVEKIAMEKFFVDRMKKIDLWSDEEIKRIKDERETLNQFHRFLKRREHA